MTMRLASVRSPIVTGCRTGLADESDADAFGADEFGTDEFGKA
jgi:hypothetical protein